MKQPNLYDRVLHDKGWCEITGIYPNRGKYQLRHLDSNESFTAYEDSFMTEMFIEYITRSDGFGVMPWPEFLLLQFVFAVVAAAGIVTWNDHGIVGVAVAVISELVLLGLTFHRFHSNAE